MNEEQKDLTVFDRLDTQLGAIEKLGGFIARSGLFSCEKVEQGILFAFAAVVEKKNPLELARRYFVIDGRLSMKAEAVHAAFENDSGSIDWIRTDGEVCEAIFSHPKAKKPITIKVTLDELIKSGVANAKDGKLKTNYQKFPRQMLRARAISEGVRMIRPGIIVGIAVAEEAGDEPLNGVPSQPTKITLTPALPPAEAVPVSGTVITEVQNKAEPSADAWAKITALGTKPPDWSAEAKTGVYKKSKAMEKAEKTEKTEKTEKPKEEPAAPVLAPAQVQEDPLSQDTEVAAIEALFKGKEFEVNVWLVDANWIKPLDSWESLRDDQRKKILAKPEAFMRAVEQKKQAAPATT